MSSSSNSYVSDNNSSLSYNTPKQRQQWDEEKLMVSGSTMTGGIGIVHNVEQLLINMRTRSPRKHSASEKRDKQEMESVLESLGNPDGRKRQRRGEAPLGTINESTTVNQTLPQGTTGQSNNVSQMLVFDDVEWKVLSKGYLLNKTLKRDHAVAYLGTGASEEEIQNEFNEMQLLDKKLAQFGNRVVRKIMLENFYRNNLTRKYDGTQVATTFDDVKDRWENWEKEKEPELAEIYYNNIVGWFDVNKNWLQISEQEFLDDKRYKWKDNEEVKRIKGHKPKMNFIQHRLSIAKTNAVKEIARVSEKITSHGFYINGTADRDKVPSSFRKKPGVYHEAYLHSHANKKAPAAKTKPTQQPKDMNRNPECVKDKRENASKQQNESYQTTRRNEVQIVTFLFLLNNHRLTIILLFADNYQKTQACAKDHSNHTR